MYTSVYLCLVYIPHRIFYVDHPYILLQVRYRTGAPKDFKNGQYKNVRVLNVEYAVWNSSKMYRGCVPCRKCSADSRPKHKMGSPNIDSRPRN